MEVLERLRKPLRYPTELRGQSTRQVDRIKREMRVPRVYREVMQNYQQVMNALASSDQGDDPQLAADLVRHFTGRSRMTEPEPGRSLERE